jgi:hypothetical protein
MVRRRFLLGAAVVAALTASLATGALPAYACNPTIGYLGCDLEVDGGISGGEAVLDGVIHGGGDAGIDALHQDTGESEMQSGNPQLPADPPIPPPPANCSPANVALCAGVPSAEPEDDPAAPVVVTLRDIASFRPAAPAGDMEPGGWAVEGLPANFVAAASVEVVSGTLLGQPADVRFTPVGFRWVHSDGGLVESGTPGATWATLGQAEFTATATSHTYAASGEYTVELEVVLRAEYRFAGSPWRSIAGTLAISSGPQRVLVGEFDTVLTQDDCIADPAGPGC